MLQDIKGDSSKWIHSKGFVKSRFSWQEGFGAFSYSKSQISDVISYIHNQPIHHQTINFIDEYLSFLKEFEINFDGRYIFTPVDYNRTELLRYLT